MSGVLPTPPGPAQRSEAKEAKKSKFKKKKMRGGMAVDVDAKLLGLVAGWLAVDGTSPAAVRKRDELSACLVGEEVAKDEQDVIGEAKSGGAAPGKKANLRMLKRKMRLQQAKRRRARRMKKMDGMVRRKARWEPTSKTPEPHSKRPAALSSRSLELSFGYVMDPTLVPTIFKGERPTHRIGAHSPL